MYSPQALYEYNDLMQQMLASNAQYLGISVGILVFIGGFFYLINVKPFQTELKETIKKVEQLLSKNSEIAEENKQLKKEIARMYRASKSNLEKLTLEQANRFAELEDKISSVTDSLSQDIAEKTKEISEISEKKASQLDWQIEWNNHYLWDRRGIPSNALIALSACLRNATTTGTDWQIEMTLKKLSTYFAEHNKVLKAHNIWNVYSTQIITAARTLVDSKHKTEAEALINQIEQ